MELLSMAGGSQLKKKKIYETNKKPLICGLVVISIPQCVFMENHIKNMIFSLK